jgi:SurA N-terminal domain
VAQGSIAAARSVAATPRSVRALVAAALAAVVVLLASGCVGGSPSTVAYVGDDRVTQTQLDVALSGVQQTLEQGQQVSAEAVVNVLIAGRIAEQIAAQNGITISDAQRDELLADSNLAPLLEVPEAKQIAYDVADQQLVAAAIGSEAYVKEMQAVAVELNPRFGVLDPASQAIVEGQSSSLSLPATSS